MKNNKVIKVEHIWCDSNDRWIYLEYNEQNKICGMNFMQGDYYKGFREDWCYKSLVGYYHSHTTIV